MNDNILKISTLIEEKGIKKIFIIRKLNISEATFYGYLNGKTEIPMNIFLEILKILEVKPEDFFKNE
jgi:DNA-binding Xre family transcriptional regulator